MGAASRRRALRRLIAEHAVHSQEDLLRLLAAAGHRVSQSTVSRDLEAIGARKVPERQRADALRRRWAACRPTPPNWPQPWPST